MNIHILSESKELRIKCNLTINMAKVNIEKYLTELRKQAKNPDYCMKTGFLSLICFHLKCVVLLLCALLG